MAPELVHAVQPSIRDVRRLEPFDHLVGAQRGKYALDLGMQRVAVGKPRRAGGKARLGRSEEHTSELQSQSNLVCRLLLEKKKTNCMDGTMSASTNDPGAQR